MKTYYFDIYLDGEYLKQVATPGRDYWEAEEKTVEQYGDEIELVRIDNI